MKIHEIAAPRTASKKRVGRGIGSGTGKTAGRGTKGQNARSGGKRKPGFEGGQTKLAQRLPKARGFKAINRQEFQVVNVSDVAELKAAHVTAEVLQQAGKIADAKKPVKLLGDGEVTAKLSVTVTAASRSAVAKIEKAGGKVVVDAPQKTSKPSKAKADKK